MLVGPFYWADRKYKKGLLHTTFFKNFPTPTNQENTPETASGTMGAESGVSFYPGSEVFSLIGCNRTIFRPIFDRGKKLCARRSAGPQQKRNGHIQNLWEMEENDGGWTF